MRPGSKKGTVNVLPINKTRPPRLGLKTGRQEAKMLPLRAGARLIYMLTRHCIDVNSDETNLLNPGA